MGYVLPKGSSRQVWEDRGNKPLPQYQIPRPEPVRIPPPPPPQTSPSQQ
jgi:hypothetical protein